MLRTTDQCSSIHFPGPGSLTLPGPCSSPCGWCASTSSTSSRPSCRTTGIWFAPDFASCFCIVWICATNLGFPDQFVGARATQFGHSSCYLVSDFCSDGEVRIILLSIKETWVRSYSGNLHHLQLPRDEAPSGVLGQVE
jgi:hypothetical protein